jgi:glycosyltransferase involved in cell wall biosynthesis
MNIALDGMPLASPLTGVGHYTFELARSLALAAPSDRFTLISPLPGEPSNLELIRRRAPENLAYMNLGANLGRRLLNRRWWSVGLPLHLKSSSYDLFHGTNYEIPLWSKQPSVVTIHDLSLFLYPEAHESRLVRRARWRLPLMARSASQIITPTEHVKSEVCERFGIDAEKVTITPEAPRSIFKKLQERETLETRKRLGISDDFILFVGTLEPRKNLQRLVEAFERVVKESSLRTQLVIAGGRGWLMDDFEAALAAKEMRDRICFTGYLHDEDLCALYSSCKAFVYPSLYEGFGLPPLEAMACGAPVIASDTGAIRETVGDAARLVDPKSVGDLAHAVAELLTNENLRQKLSAAGLERVKNFSWEQTAVKTLVVYRDLRNPWLRTGSDTPSSR